MERRRKSQRTKHVWRRALAGRRNSRWIRGRYTSVGAYRSTRRKWLPLVSRKRAQDSRRSIATSTIQTPTPASSIVHSTTQRIRAGTLSARIRQHGRSSLTTGDFALTLAQHSLSASERRVEHTIITHQIYLTRASATSKRAHTELRAEPNVAVLALITTLEPSIRRP